MSTPTHRPVPLFLSGLVALFAALVALAVSGGHDAGAHAGQGHATPAAVTAPELALRQEMRRLWEDHITWTRLAVIS